MGGVGPGVGGFPGGYAVFYGGLLVGGDVFAYALAVGGVLGLVWARDGGCEAEPVVGFDVILLDAHADGVEQAQGALRAGVALVGGFAVPGYGLLHVAGHAAAVAIELGQVNLGRDVSTVGGLAVPEGCLGVIGGSLAGIARRTVAGGIGVPGLDLGGDIAGGCLAQQSWVDGRGRSGWSLRRGRSQYWKDSRS